MEQRLITMLEAGFKQQQQGKLSQAKEHYLAVLNEDNENVFALNLLGVLCVREQAFEQASQYLERVLTLNKSDAETYCNLGLTYQGLKRLTDAKDMFEKSLAINSQQPVVLNNLGNILASLNEHHKALYCFDSAMKLDNRYIDCLHNMFISLKTLKQYDKAIQLIDYILKIDPKNSRALTNQGEVYKQQLDYKQAKCSFEKAITIDNNLEAKIQLSSVLKLLAQEHQAKSLLLEVLAIEPHNVEANNHLGVLLEQLGDFEQAATYFRKALSYNENHASSYFQLSKLKNERLTSAEIDKIQTLLADENTIELFKSSLFLALAWDYEKQKDYQQSIDFFIKGKSIKAKETPYSNQPALEYLAQSKTVYPVTTHDNLSVKNIDVLTPIFIIGMPRSGTTLTEQVLASHSNVYGAGELGYINELVQMAVSMTGVPYPHCVAKLTEQNINTLRQNYLAKITPLCKEKSFFVDKNPLNYQSVGFIELLFPMAKFIYCKREAMDNCISIFKLPFDDNQSYSHDLAALGDYYLQHIRLMDYWIECFPDKIIINQYESMVEDPETQAKNLLDFIGLNFESSVLYFYENKRIVLTPSAEQVRQPIYKTSINAWQRYGEAISELKVALNV